MATNFSNNSLDLYFSKSLGPLEIYKIEGWGLGIPSLVSPSKSK